MGGTHEEHGRTTEMVSVCGRLCVCLCASKVNVVVTVLESFVVAVSQDEWMTVRMLVPYILVWYCE